MATTRLKRSVPGCHRTSAPSSEGRSNVERSMSKAAGKFVNDFGLKDQIRRASVSILSNMAEGFERGGDKEFVQFLAIAKGSCGEVRAQLYVALDQGYIPTEVFDRLLTNANEVGQLLSGFIRYLKGSTLRGNKYS